MRGRIWIGVAAAALSVASVPAAGAAPKTPSDWVHAALARAQAQRAAHRAASAQPNAAAGSALPAITVHDPTGDVPFPQGDITGAGFGQDASSFTFATSVVAPTDPDRDPAWQEGSAVVAWAIDTNGDASPEYVIEVMPAPEGGLTSFIVNTASNDGCDGTAQFIAGFGYSASFANRCLPAGLSFQFQAAMLYTTDPTDANPPVDFAPDNNFSPQHYVTLKPLGPSGYWMLGADGRVYAFGRAVGYPGVVPGATAMVPRKDGTGYWITDAAGNVRAYGAASSFGGGPRLGRGERIITIATTNTDRGYWLFSNDGRSFAFGDAHLYGDMSGTPLNGPIVASAATPSGHGYYMVGSDGGIFAFGDAQFHGSTGHMHLNGRIVGMSPTPDHKGYWLVGSDGGVFAFKAPFRGSMGDKHLNQPVDGLVAFGNGYLMGAADGGVFNFSDRAFVGSLADNPPSAPIIGLAAFAT